jgi:GDPmannose 4,6-dehydratase
MKKKIALITGITGQDGSFLAEFLLDKNYEVHGLKRRTSSFNTDRIDHLYQGPLEKNKSFFLHYGDLIDAPNVTNIIKKVNPSEIYNLGAQSHVAVSFDTPEYTANVDALGTLRILEAIRMLNLKKSTRFYQASSSELYGLTQENPQNENTPFYPRSPYGVSKLFAYWITVNYREAYDLFACNGILFNHESPRRGETFVTRKVTRGLTNIALGLEKCLYMGNLNALRDWGHAKDFVEMQWLMLQQKKPEDYVIASGKQHSIRTFISWASNFLGIKIKFKGKGLKEVGVVESISGNKCPQVKEGDVIIRVDKRYFRPSEVDSLLGDSSKAKKNLGWTPKISAKQMCKEMIEHDYEIAKKNSLLKEHGHKVNISSED